MHNSSDIAIIGMAGRFPGASGIPEFWNNLVNGKESIEFFTEEQLLASGVNPLVLKHPNFVKAKANLPHADYFDASFFGISAIEASLMDPQHRIFLETVWHAVEDAGYNIQQYKGLAGIYAGCDMNTYLIYNLLSDRKRLEAFSGLQLLIASEKNHMVSRTAYLLNLCGPSVTIQTACSTGLSAIHAACQGLLSGECDLAIGGAVSISSPLKNGYVYEPGVINSPDGHCRPFDAQAAGTVSGNGVGVVVLKLMDDALQDGDFIYAVIKGSAINNDGSDKASYTSPGVDGQIRAASDAIHLAGVQPSAIGYVEASGTANPLGDAIEIEALTKAFNKFSNPGENGHCYVGSLKGNIGHLNEASGMAALIKTIAMLQHKIIPPIVGFTNPNPAISWVNSPFKFPLTATMWDSPKDTTRLACVHTFGIGGTNAHVVLEEAPPMKSVDQESNPELFIFSAKTASALQETIRLQMDHLKKGVHSLSDTAYTLQVGRKEFNYRGYGVYTQEKGNLTGSSDLVTSSEITQKPTLIFYLRTLGFRPKQGLEWIQRQPYLVKYFDQCRIWMEKFHTPDLSDYFHREEWDAINSFLFSYCLFNGLQELGATFPIIYFDPTHWLTAACLAEALSEQKALLHLLEKEPLPEFGPLRKLLYTAEMRPIEEVTPITEWYSNPLSNPPATFAEFESILPKNKQGLVVCSSLQIYHPGSADKHRVTTELGLYELGLHLLGQLWLHGISIQWLNVHGTRKNRVPLPGYPFERSRYWFDIQYERKEEVSNPEDPQEPFWMPLEEITPEHIRTLVQTSWQQAFHMKAIANDANFFDLGGHSLMGMQILTRIKAVYGLELSPNTLYEYPIMHDFISLVENKLWLIHSNRNVETISELEEIGIL